MEGAAVLEEISVENLCGCSGGSYLACARLWVPLPAMPKLHV